MKKRSEEVTGEKLDSLIGEITTDAYGDDERAFHCAFKDGFKLPCDAFVIGEPVSVIGFDYGGNQRRGLVARCRKKDGPEHRVAVSEVAIAEQSRGGHLIAAYRKWAGLNPWPEQAAPSCAACTGSACACGGLNVSRRLSASSNGCSGSTRWTIRACAS